MKNIKKIAINLIDEFSSSEIGRTEAVELPKELRLQPTCEEIFNETAVSNISNIKIPISVEYVETQFGTSKVPRITVNLIDIAVELEKKYNTEQNRTEILQGKDNLIHFDLEPKD